jgi:hypothetical protein
MSLDDAGAFTAVWSPDIPRHLTSQELNQYLTARNQLIAELRCAMPAINAALLGYAKSTWSQQ